MLSSTEHDILTAHKTTIPTNKEVIGLSISDFVIIMLINVKMPTIAELSMKKYNLRAWLLSIVCVMCYCYYIEPHRRHCVVVIEQDTFILA